MHVVVSDDRFLPCILGVKIDIYIDTLNEFQYLNDN